MQYVAFAYRRGSVPPGGNLDNLPVLFELLRERDLRPVVSLMAERAFMGDQLQVNDVRHDGCEPITVAAGEVAVADVAVLVNRMGRSIKHDQLRPGLELPPMINENTTRSLAWDKDNADKRLIAPVLGALGLRIPTQLITDAATAQAFMRTMSADRYVVKANNGMGEGVVILDIQGITDWVDRSIGDPKPWILQPAYDFTGPLPPYLKPYDGANTESFEGWSKSVFPKELRIYGMHSPENTQVFPVARALASGQDEWFFVDPDSVPPDLMEPARLLTSEAARITGAAALLGSFDFGYGPLMGKQGAGWRLIEFNGRSPYVLAADKHAGIAYVLREMLADTIQQTANHGKLVA